MRIRRILKSKTAFSAVIASLILMLIAVAAGVVVYAYVMGWIGNASQSSASTGVLSIDSVTAFPVYRSNKICNRSRYTNV